MTIAELTRLVLPRVTEAKCSIIDAVRAVQQVLVNQLLVLQSDLIQQELSLSYTTAAVTLPDGFQAVAALPRLSGSLTGYLVPVGDLDTTASTMTTAGTPAYYAIMGRTLTLYPPPAASGSLVVPAYVRPALLTSDAGVLPFYGMFDEVFIDGTVFVLAQGLGAVADRGFSSMVTTMVNQVVHAKTLMDEELFVQAINRR